MAFRCPVLKKILEERARPWLYAGATPIKACEQQQRDEFAWHGRDPAYRV